MAELEFLASDLRRETLALADFAAEFLEGASIAVLKEAAAQFENAILYNGGIARVDDDRPIRSKPTRAYGGAFHVWADVSWIWELARVRKTKYLRLAGKASSRIRFRRQGDQGVEEIAMWRMEIADDASPGCHFHVQVSGEGAASPFPNWIDVPRLPAYLTTPAMAVEFALAELFQVEWAQATSIQQRSIQEWSAIHQPRLSAVLDWQVRRLKPGTYTGAPMTALKAWKPDESLIEAVAGRT